MRLPLLLCFLVVCAWALESDPNIVSMTDKKPVVWQVYGVRRAEAIDSKRIRLTIGHACNSGVLEARKSYRIVSEDDPYYAYKHFVMPLKAVHLNKKQEKELTSPTGGKGGMQVFNRYLVELQLPKAMENGKAYSVVCYGNDSSMVSSACTAATLTFRNGQFVQPLEIKEDPQTLTVMGLRGASPVGNGIIRLEFGAAFSPEAGNYLKNYSVMLDGMPVKILKFGRRSKIDAYQPTGWPFPAIMTHEIFLQLDRPLAEGVKVRVSVSPKACSGANETGFTFNSRRTFSDSIKVNQVGYLADVPLKRAYLGRWLGSFPDKNAVGAGDENKGVAIDADEFFNAALGKHGQTDEKTTLAPFALAFEKPPVFYLINAENSETVYRGTAVLGHNGLEMDDKVNHSAENVYYLDFNDFKTPGRYFISVDGVGRSVEFAIGDDVYQSAFQMASYGVFLQRCGIELGPPYTPWRRVACHADGIIETTQQRISSGEFIDKKNQVMVKNPHGRDPNAEKIKQLPSLIAYYPFEGNAANAIDDGMTLTPRGEAKFAPDSDVTGGDTDKVYTTLSGWDNGFTGQLDFDENKGLTFSFWYRKDDRVSGNKIDGVILSLQGERNAGLKLACIWGVPNLNMNNGKTTYKRVGDNVWRHWGITVAPLSAADNRGSRDWEVSLFIDGELINNFKNKGTIGKQFIFGALGGSGAANGYFDELRIYNKVLDSKEMHLLSIRHQAMIPKRLVASGGHHDAGDYNPRSHIDIAQNLLDAYELAPQKFSDGQLNIPENNNGIPDIVDEALWALKLWIGLQDDDGGVFNGTESDGDPNFIQSADLDPKGDFARAKDCKGSFIFAGTMAQAARILKSLDRNDIANDYLARAKRAYDWGCNNKPETKDMKKFGEYAISSRAYAAAQLFHTTADQTYHQDFQKFTPWIKDASAKMITDDHSYDLSLAAFAYSMISDNMADRNLKDSVIRAIEGEVDMYINGSKKMAYKFIRHPFAPITWGTGAYEHFLVPVWHAWGVTRSMQKRKEYFEWMIRTADNTLGANPLNISWIVGLGERTVRAPLHNSRYNPTGMCMPGQQVQGPNQRGEGYNYVQTVYPHHDNSFAVMHTFVDCHWAIAMDEGTVIHQGETMAAFGLLLGDKKQ
jgi:Glycosyl hydrolase family 9./N-terminal ig-like domain of cellulase.